MNAQTVRENCCSLLLLVHEIINIQFFITQSSTDASIIWGEYGEGEGPSYITFLELIAPVCIRQQKQKLFVFHFGEMIYVIM